MSMHYRWSIAVAIVCLAAVDLPHGSSLVPPQPNATQPFPSGENIPVLPVIVVDDSPTQDKTGNCCTEEGQHADRTFQTCADSLRVRGICEDAKGITGRQRRLRSLCG